MALRKKSIYTQNYYQTVHSFCDNTIFQTTINNKATTSHHPHPFLSSHKYILFNMSPSLEHHTNVRTSTNTLKSRHDGRGGKSITSNNYYSIEAGIFDVELLYFLFDILSFMYGKCRNQLGMLYVFANRFYRSYQSLFVPHT